MRRRFFLALILAMATTAGWAQSDVSSKLSVTTQMFLDERAGNLSFEQSEEIVKNVAKAKNISLAEAARITKYDRPIVGPVDIDGRQFISAFVRVSDRSAVSELEALGVEVQCEFLSGTLLTTMIPVDRLQEVAGLAKVSRVSVSAKRRPLTDKARQATNADDALTLSSDALQEGLTKKYDGTGVLLGIIDTGIDFQHIAFKDKNGNTRIKRAYVYTGSGSAREYGDGASYSITSSAPTTDDSSEDHGTHTSSAAGGSSVVVSGSSVTVTDDHANATYGGMAPGADLYLAGCDLSDTYLANSFQKICNYADSKGMPVVVSNSWGSQIGPHDGTGAFADIVASYFGDSHPNHICLFAASNDAGTNGFYVTGTASSSSPLGTVVNWNTDYGLTYYYGIIASAWTRSTGKTLACKVIVINSSGTKQTEVTVNPTSNGSTVSLGNYVSGGSLVAYKDYEGSSEKSQIVLYTNGLQMRSGYKLAVQFYPTSGSDVVDVWSTSIYTYYSNTPSTSGYAWTAPSDDVCVSDEATIPDAISIGAYVTKNSVKDYNGTSHTLSDFSTIGDIAYFSSYATADQSPTGLAYPWICAPGATIVSAVNHYDTSGDYSYINGNSAYYDMYRVNSSTTNPYGSMEGTSMATPVAAGIVALWLQAAQEVGKELTVNDVKEIMKETAITDAYTNGTNASHFGHGKIDALAGIKYILGAMSEPTVKVDKPEVNFEGFVTRTYKDTIEVTGSSLEGHITVNMTGDKCFSVNLRSISQTDGKAKGSLVVTYAPTAAGSHRAAVTLTSTNAETVTINITGTAEAATPTILVADAAMDFTADLDSEVSQTLSVGGRFIDSDVTLTLTGGNGAFSVSPTTLTAAQIAEGAEVAVTFLAAEEGSYNATLTLTSEGAEPVIIALTATASDGGTASDPYLNIAKYATIDEAGWNQTYVNTLYKYTVYEDQEVAWLTLPIYGAWSAVYYSPNAQAWIETNVTNTSNKYYGTSWNASDDLLGSSPYFTTAKARVMGYNSRQNYTQETVTFYVTNTTAVELLGLGQSRTNSTYPATLKIYECTVDVDGNPTAASTAVKSESNSSTSDTFVLSATGLDAKKVYKVEAATYRSYIAEIGFQTPLPMKPGDVNRDGHIDVADAEAIANYVLGLPQEGEFNAAAADVNGDGKISVSDAAEIIKNILNQ